MVTATTFVVLAAISWPNNCLVRFTMLSSSPLVSSASDLLLTPAAQPFQPASVTSASSTVVVLAHDLSEAYHRSVFIFKS